jgi:hypothetical protein
MKNSIATLEFNTQEDFKSLVHQLEQQGQQEATKTDQLALSLDKLQTEFTDRYQNQQKDVAFIKDALLACEKESKTSEFYLNKVLPIKQFSLTCNLMHTVLGDTNKVGLNHLIQYEHSKYQEILQDLNLASSQEQLRQFEIDSYLPTNMPLIRETRERI